MRVSFLESLPIFAAGIVPDHHSYLTDRSHCAIANNAAAPSAENVRMWFQKRHRFFLERNWVVIRFSELQIVKYPESCCKAIARVIFEITGDFRGLSQLQNLADLLPHKQWESQETF